MNTVRIHNPHNVFLYDNTNILPGFIFISHRGQFFFHQGSAAAQNLTVVTDSHIRKVGKLFKDEELFYKYKDNISENVVVEEDVWIGTNVTLLPGVTIGRGSNVGAGTVIRGKVPPYSIVSGNPGKVIGFTFTPEEIIEHEKALYPEEDRLPLELLEKNYEKYFLKRLKEIKEFNRL
ncbi:galactoside O-acetyltransferase [Bacteroides thetaiotaomicron]|uniref:Galactoside O-acetyltransferase n=1 Tax=Bacteroides thetaiotaomicron TaxID=818 RepID=A0AB38UC22_BACT4|nr:galactoside O-acetyltransferase [Bacteroides thetaiotaomicron]MBV3927261.1 galactoside O-acetyltransferase [Bacteroides thetaiotaomicron]MCM1779816.1 galactoside O-acetyltransferase [Bacteroides thetaiotaomicron]MCS2485816.1 galactoside O-acetyltransferase [Bacteroides thetaiotaomicron]MCS2771528.1 galactoside O-acetyltransferase [Bacteroides thetaiotaomicron]MCS3078513.1 galactoside O-acetyltransferase [Bacteroides thetaiotaomicron]